MNWQQMWGDRTADEARSVLRSVQPGTLLRWDTANLRAGLAMVVAKQGYVIWVVFDGRRREIKRYDLAPAGYDTSNDGRHHFNPSSCSPLLLPDGSEARFAVQSFPQSGSIRP